MCCHIYIYIYIYIYIHTHTYIFIYTVYIHEACPESKDTKVLNMYNIFNLQKRHCE